jgi:hypothetical protein
MTSSLASETAMVPESRSLSGDQLCQYGSISSQQQNSALFDMFKPSFVFCLAEVEVQLGAYAFRAGLFHVP